MYACLRHQSYRTRNGRDEETKTPAMTLVGLTRFELVTSRLSAVRSNQLSYRPKLTSGDQRETRAEDQLLIRPLLGLS